MGAKLEKAGPKFSPVQMAIKYCRYYYSAANGKGHGIHSPFVFDFIRKTLNDKKEYSEYARVEGLRKQLLGAHAPVETEDMGAGSGSHARTKTVAAIVASAAKPPKLAQLLFRIARYYRPRRIIELGTSLGISSSYLALADPEARVITAEGNRNLVSLARENFRRLHISSIHVVEGNFDDTLEQIIGEAPETDLVFIDGNHRKEPTIRYFQRLLTCMSPSSVMIFDDIHWSSEMESAWDNIKDHPSVMMTIDLFFMGLIFFRPEFKVKQHFTIRY